MSINQRQVRILSVLLGADRFTPTADIARAANCSERTVRNDTKAINTFLKQNRLRTRIDSKRGNGMRLTVGSAEHDCVVDLVQECAIAVDASLDRFYRGMLLLTCDFNRTYTIESLARAIFTNKQQMQEDLRAWNEKLAPYRAQIVRGRTLSVKGPEELIRYFIVYNMFELASTAMKRRIEPQIFGDDVTVGDRPFYAREISRIETIINKPLTDNARHQIAVYMQISVLRIKCGHAITAGASSIDPVYHELCDHMEQRFGIAMPPGERAVIRDLFTVSTRRWTPAFQRTFRPCPEAAYYTEKLVAALTAKFGKRPPKHLDKPLAALIEAGLTHTLLERFISLPRENTWAVRYENMTSFMRLCEVLRDAPELRPLAFYETDYTRIAMLLLSYMDGLATHDLMSVGLVVNCGIEQVFYARDRIERLIPGTRITRVLTERELIALEDANELEDLDFLVTFDPIRTSLPFAIISNAIDDSDRGRINDVIMRVGNSHPAQRDLAHLDHITTHNLEVEAGVSFKRALHRALVADGLWQGPLLEFPTVLEMCSFHSDEWMFLTAFSRDVRATGAVRYEIDGDVDLSGQKLSHILVLTVAPEDERIVTAVATQFKVLAHQAHAVQESLV